MNAYPVSDRYGYDEDKGMTTIHTPGGRQQVTVMIEEGGRSSDKSSGPEPWFVLSDVCKILGINNPSDTKKRLNPVDLDIVEVYGTQRNRAYKANAVNESGL